jgi:hypothetical protein
VIKKFSRSSNFQNWKEKLYIDIDVSNKIIMSCNILLKLGKFYITHIKHLKKKKTFFKKISE